MSARVRLERFFFERCEAFWRPVQLILLAALMLSPPVSFAADQPEPPPHADVGKRFIPTNVDWAKPVYQTTFDNTAELENWKLEGGKRLAIEHGKLVLENADKENHLVCWLKTEAPADFLLEFTVRPQNRQEGLNIVFFNARGARGESVFDPTLKPRSGVFREYHSGDLSNYHISYWAGNRGTANVRKNAGFHLVATGTDLIASAPADTFQTIRLYKRGGTIRLMVDDVIAVAFDDDGKTHGPVWNHSGWIALRQMGHTVRCEYDHLKIFRLKPDAAAAAATRPNASAPPPHPPAVARFKENPLIRPEMLAGRDGTNICYPSLIQVPAWLPNPLGKYYLYFADHKGAYIRLAYANQVEGPWKIYEPGTLRLDTVVAAVRAAQPASAPEIEGKHIASPDVHVDDERREIRMYFHLSLPPSQVWGHRSGIALSADGISFRPIGTKPIGEPYFRVFRRDGYYFALDRVGALTRSRDGLSDFEAGNPAFSEAVGNKTRGTGLTTIGTRNALKRESGETDSLPGEIRHSGLKIDGDVLTVFFSRGGDLPEHLMCAQAKLTGDWTSWRLSPPVSVLLPTMDYEGGNMPLEAATNQGMQKMPRPLFRELRDPYIFRDGSKTYLLYSVAGERGIAGALLSD